MCDKYWKLRKEVLDFEKETRERTTSAMPRLDATYVADKLKSIVETVEEDEN